MRRRGGVGMVAVCAVCWPGAGAESKKGQQAPKECVVRKPLCKKPPLLLLPSPAHCHRRLAHPINHTMSEARSHTSHIILQQAFVLRACL